MSDLEQRLGVDGEILLRFIDLIKKSYPLIDQANHFLEENAKYSGLSVAVTNQRDIVSHLITFLTQGLAKEDALGQLANAEEHARRAILEPYEIATSDEIEDLESIFDDYKKIVLPFLDTPGFASAPRLSEVHARLTKIKRHKEDGRRMKARNIWDDEWESGVKSLILAYSLASSLKYELDELIIAASTARQSTRSVFLGKWGLLVGICGLMIGAVAIVVTVW